MTEAERDLAILPVRGKRRVWWQFMKKYDCQRICEIGVGDGTNFLNMIAHNPNTAIAVDTWCVPEGQERNAGGQTQDELDNQRSIFRERMRHKGCAGTFLCSGVDAARHLFDAYFDLVYIDADHTYEGCKADIEAWWPKVRSGGFLLGDDYRHCTWPSGTVCGVIEAVNEFAAKEGLRVIEMPRYGWGIVKP